MPYVRTAKTSSGATAVQIVYSSHRGSREIEHLGSAHSGAEVELLKAAARRGGVQAQVKLTLTGRQPLPGRGLQQLHLSAAMRRPQMLDLPRPPAGGVHDLDSRRARRCLDRPHIRGHRATLRPEHPG